MDYTSWVLPSSDVTCEAGTMADLYWDLGPSFVLCRWLPGIQPQIVVGEGFIMDMAAPPKKGRKVVIWHPEPIFTH